MTHWINDIKYVYLRKQKHKVGSRPTRRSGDFSLPKSVASWPQAPPLVCPSSIKQCREVSELRTDHTRLRSPGLANLTKLAQNPATETLVTRKGSRVICGNESSKLNVGPRVKFESVLSKRSPSTGTSLSEQKKPLMINEIQKYESLICITRLP